MLLFCLYLVAISITFDKKQTSDIRLMALSAFSYESCSTGYFNMRVYLGEASDSAGDGSAVTGHYRSINQGPGKLGHTGHVFLLEGDCFELQAYMEKGGRGLVVWGVNPMNQCRDLQFT